MIIFEQSLWLVHFLVDFCNSIHFKVDIKLLCKRVFETYYQDALIDSDIATFLYLIVV